MKNIGTIICILFYFTAHTQFTETFSDGNLSFNPKWDGDTLDFKINQNEVLQLDAPEAGRSFLHTPYEWQDSMHWSLYFQLNFSPSNSNQLRIYLLASDPDLEQAESIYLEIGQTGSEDPIRFYHHKQGKDSLLFTAEARQFSDPENKIQIEVNCKEFSNWEFWSDYDASGNIQLEETFYYETDFSNQVYFGLECVYTSSRRDKFYFDNIQVEKIIPDVLGPVVASVEVINAQEIKIVFDENISIQSAEDLANYIVNGNRNPSAAKLDSMNRRLVYLHFDSLLLNGENQSLQIVHVQDDLGNQTASQLRYFNYFEISKANPFEILINEIMADPKPPRLLPEAEYVELYNNSEHFFQLSEYAIQSGSSLQSFPSFILPPRSHIILCHEDNASLFVHLGETMGLPTFPILSNTGDDLKLLNQDLNPIHALEYDLSWYQDDIKSDGGWSLEMINPNAICEFKSNWSASKDPSGGSPGRRNAVFDSSPVDLIEILSVRLIDSLTIEIETSGTLDELSFSERSFLIEPSLPVLDITNPSHLVYQIHLLEKANRNILYHLSALDVLSCQGSILSDKKLAFAIPGIPVHQDILINEILFNPRSGGSDYLELYNPSDQIFALEDFRLINVESQEEFQIQSKALLFPKQYVLLTEEPSVVKEQYFVVEDSNFIKQNLPAFPDREGNITLFYQQGVEFTLIDSFDYSQDFHSPFLSDLNGVSLERIQFGNGDLNSLWQSAASSSFFGTPGKQNSQFIIGGNAEEKVWIENQTFSPDGDGYKDQLIIHFTLNQGSQCQIKIFNERGHFVHHLANNISLGPESIVSWDGQVDGNENALIGPYYLHILLFQENGKVESYKKACILALQLE